VLLRFARSIKYCKFTQVNDDDPAVNDDPYGLIVNDDDPVLKVMLLEYKVTTLL
jgi:hypothetical protein